MTKENPSETVNLKELSVVIPIYNQGKNIYSLLQKVRDLSPDITIITVNDGSTDNSLEEIKRANTSKIINHQNNLGYGASVRNGIRACDTRVVCWFDGDDQHLPEDILRISTPVLEGKGVACLGQRHILATQKERVIGKIILNWVANYIAMQKIPDINCGLRAFDRKMLLQYIHLFPNGFSASLTTTMIMIKRGYNIVWKEITVKKRVGKSSVNIFKDGFRSLKIIFRIIILFSALRFFSLLGLFFFMIGLSWGIYVQYIIQKGIPAISVGFMVLSVFSVLFGILIEQIAEIRKEKFEH